MELNKNKGDFEAIEALGYDSINRILRVWLIDGRIFDYFSVPPTRFQSFLKAPFKDTYYDAVIKKLYKEFKEVIEVS